MRWICALGVFLFTCGGVAPEASAPSRALNEPPAIEVMTLAETPTERVSQSASEAPDPYEGWASWCEPLDYDHSCQSHEECATAHPNHPAQRPMRCFNPWYAKMRPEYKVCAPGHAGKRERGWREDRLREVIRQQYFNEAEICGPDDGRPLWRHGWRCEKAAARGDKLLAFLWVGYMRETTARPWKRHRLDADVKASRTAWFKMADRYGWTIETAQGEVASMTAGPGANPYYGQRYRWHFGLGPIGQNAPLWVHNWDPQAPPEILCREVEPFEAYLRRARDALTTLRHGIRCDGEYYEDKSPTWEVLHRAVNLGSVCPPSNARHQRGLARFRKHAERHGLKYDEVVTAAMLGEPIPVEAQNERAAEIYAVLERKLPKMQ